MVDDAGDCVAREALIGAAAPSMAVEDDVVKTVRRSQELIAASHCLLAESRKNIPPKD